MTHTLSNLASEISSLSIATPANTDNSSFLAISHLSLNLMFYLIILIHYVMYFFLEKDRLKAADNFLFKW